MKKNISIFFIFNALIFLGYTQCYAQIIITIAGGATGHGGYWGDGGAATAATIGYTPGIALDRSGNLYIADGNNQRVREVNSSTGIITTIAGTGVGGYNGDNIAATAAQLNSPAWLAIDTANNIYVEDGGNYRIRKIDALTGIITTYAGTGVAGYFGDGASATNAKIDGVQGMCTDIFGNLYINDGANYRVRKIDASGIVTTICGTGIAMNGGDNGPASTATISGMLGICTDNLGNIYTTDSSASIRKINVSTNIITRVVGTGNNISTPYLGDGVSATTSQISPFGVAVDNVGNIYVADYSNSRIEKVDTFGIIHTIAGTGVSGFSGDGFAATTAKISLPENVILDPCGNVYISDYNNKRVRKVTYHATCTTGDLNVNSVKPNSVISIYPNPASDVLHIDGVGSTSLSTSGEGRDEVYRILSIVGAIMQQGVLKEGSNSISIRSLPAGMYMVEVTGEEGRRTVRKIIKQ